MLIGYTLISDVIIGNSPTMKQSKYISSLLYQIKKSTSAHKTVTLYLAAIEYYSNADNHLAEKYLSIVLELYSKVSPELQHRIFLAAASVYNFLGNETKVIDFIERARVISSHCENVELQNAIVDLFVLVVQGRSGNPQRLLEGIRGLFSVINDYGTSRDRITLFHAYGLSLSFVGKHDEALEFLLKSVEQSVLIESCVTQVRSMLAIIEIYSRLGLNEEVVEYSSRALSIAEHYDLRHLIGRCHMYRGRNLFYLGKLNESIEELKKAHLLFIEVNDKQEEYFSRINLSVTYRELGLIEDAVQILIPLLQLEEKIWWQIRYHAYTQIGLLFLIIGDPEKAVSLLSIALSQLSKPEIIPVLFTAPLKADLGYAYLLQNDYQRSEEYLYRVLGVFIESDVHREVSGTLDKISVLFYVQGDYERAEETAQQALLISKKVAFAKGIINANIILSEIYIKQNRRDEAVFLLTEVLELATQTMYLHSEIMVHKLLTKIYEENGDELKAYKHLKKYNELHEKFWNREVASNVYDVFRVLEEQRHRNEENLLTRAKEQLEIEVKQRERELRTLAIQLTQRNQAFQVLKTEVEKIRADSVKKKKKSLPKELIESVKSLESNWDTFRLRFDTVHAGFYQRLVTMFPELTETETKVCCLMKVDLSTKQIADVLLVSSRTIETHRLRIRRKIMKNRNVDLRKYLLSIE